MRTIYFVTTNKTKFSKLEHSFQESSATLKQYNCALNELQTMDKTEIIKDKLQQAKKLLPGKEIIVDDRGFYISALRGFPGPLIKPVLDSIGIQGLLQLLQHKEDRQACFICAIGYYDGTHDHYFFDEEAGVIVTKPRGENTREWTDLHFIFSSESFPDKTLAQLSDDEWSAHCALQAEKDCGAQLLRRGRDSNSRGPKRTSRFSKPD